MNTVLYLTDNSLDPVIDRLCRRVLLREADGLPLISVSQRPVDLGVNVCVGEIGRSWLSLYRQLLAGLEVIRTEYIVIAEHDCLYPAEHLHWTPPDGERFFYNCNCWLCEGPGGTHPELYGMYSYWSRTRAALSQLVCSAALLRESITERLALIESGIRAMRRLGEHGAYDAQQVTLARRATDGRAGYLTPMLESHLAKFKSDFFVTSAPTVDIRHATNFSGPRRGKRRRYELPYWGRFAELMDGS